MIKRNKLFSVLVAILSLFMFANCAFAAEKPNMIPKPSDLTPMNLSSSDYQVKSDTDGNQVIEITNPRAFLESQKIEIPKGVKDVEVIIKTNQSDITESPNSSLSDTVTSQNSSKVSPLATGYYVSPYHYEDRTDYNNVIGMTSGSTGTITCTATFQQQAQYTCSVSVSASVVSAGVGYNVTKSYSIASSQAAKTNDRYTEIYAFPTYHITDFEIYNSSGVYVGNGYSMRVVGAAFVVYRY